MQSVPCVRGKIVKYLRKNSIEDANYEFDEMLSYVTGVPRNQIYFLSSLSEKYYKKLMYIALRRTKGEPLQYILKNCDFYGFNLYIRKGVFIPRPETEILVEETIKLTKELRINSKLLIADIGCGSGCISIALAKNIKNCFIYATDISKLALNCARYNARKYNVEKKIKFLKGKYLLPLKGLKDKIDIIVFNPPYIPTTSIPYLQKEVLMEPKMAIDGGKDGLSFYRKIANSLHNYLKKKGFAIMEIGKGQKDSICRIFLKHNFSLQKVINDYSDIERVLIFKVP